MKESANEFRSQWRKLKVIDSLEKRRNKQQQQQRRGHIYCVCTLYSVQRARWIEPVQWLTCGMCVCTWAFLSARSIFSSLRFMHDQMNARTFEQSHAANPKLMAKPKQRLSNVCSNSYIRSKAPDQSIFRSNEEHQELSACLIKQSNDDLRKEALYLLVAFQKKYSCKFRKFPKKFQRREKRVLIMRK